MTLQRALVLFIMIITLSCGHDAERAKRSALQKGQDFYLKGESAAAEIQFRKALQEDPRYGDAYLWLGRVAKQQGNYAQAFDGLKRAVALMPDQDLPKVELVNLMLLAYLGDPSRPAALYDQISLLSEDLIAKSKDSFEGMRVKGYLAMADASPTKAIGYFEEANRIRPDQADVITGMVQSLFLDNQVRRAEESARSFLDRHPDCGPMYTILYEHFLQSRRSNDAEAILKSKVANNPKVAMYRIELARNYQRAGDMRAVGDVLSGLLDNPKDFPDAAMDVGDFYAEFGKWADAQREYERGLQSAPDSRVTYWKRLGRVYLATNDHRAAAQLLDQVLKVHPRDPEARAARAALRMAGNDVGEKKRAVVEFKGLVSEFPEVTDYHLQYAEALRFSGELDSAKAQYQAVLEREPRNLTVIQELADLSIRSGRLDEALEYADRVLAIDRQNVRASLVRSAALASKGRFVETRLVLNEVLKQQPELREAQMQMALLDVEERHYGEAEKRFRKYYQTGKGDIRPLKGLLELYRVQNQMDRALTLLREDLAKRPDSTEVRTLLAKAAADSGQHDLAIEHYQQLGRSRPDLLDIPLELGLAYQATHNPTRAVTEFERALKLAPDNALVYGYLGKALDEAGQKQQALSAYRQSLLLAPHNPWVMNNLAYLIAETGGDLNQALKLAQDARREQPNDPSFGDTLGWLYLKRGDFASAVHVLEAVRDKSPKTVMFRIHLADALIASGNHAKGRAELMDARQLPCSQDERDQISVLLSNSGPVR